MSKLDTLLERVRYEESREREPSIVAQVTDHKNPWYLLKGDLVAVTDEGYVVEFKLADIHYPFNKHRKTFKPSQLYLKEK